ncbi:MAG: hypothetical protein ACOY3J_07600 [Bacillota bacterium]
MVKKLRLLANIFLGFSLLSAAYGFYQIYLFRATLPPGVCPVDNNRTFLYLGIAFALSSLILDYTAGRYEKKD